MNEYIKAIPEIAKEINSIVHIKDIKDAINSSSSVTSLVLNLILTPIMNKITEPTLKKFLDTLKSIIGASIKETGLDKEIYRFIKHDFKRRFNIIMTKWANPEVIKKDFTQDYRWPPIFPPLQFIKDIVRGSLCEINIIQEDIDKCIKSINEKSITEYQQPGWGELFKKIQEKEYARNEIIYLTNLAEKLKAPIGIDEPPFEDMYIKEKGYFLKNNLWGGFTKEQIEERKKIKPEEVVEVEDMHGSIKQYFSNEKMKQYPHYSDNNKTMKILFCSSHFGVGKSTFLIEYAGRLALNYLNTMEGDFPVFLELKKINQDTDIEEYIRIQDNLELKTDNHRSYFFLMDALDESCSPAKEDLEIILDKLFILFNTYKEQNKNTKMLITSRPLLGPAGYLAQRIINLSDKFLHINGFDSEQGEKYIHNVRKYDPELEEELSMNIIIDKLLPKEADYSKPLFLKMILQLFQHKVFTVEKLRERDSISKVEMYLTFLNNLTVREKLNEEEDREVKIIFRYFLRKIAARREMNSHKFLKEKGVDIGRFKETLDPEEKKLFKIIEEKKILMICHFGVNKEFLEFIHLSFREYLVAEYLLEIFLLNIAGRGKKYQLHIGYISNEAIEMFDGLVEEFSCYINNPDDPKRKEMFDQFLASIHKTCDSVNILKYLKEENSITCLNKDITNELKDALFTATKNWLDDTTVYFTSNAGEENSIGERINTSKVILSRNSVYCEYWYCLLFIKRFIKERISIDLREVLPESLHSRHFRKRLVQYCLNGNLEINLNGADLCRADLSETDLSGCNLSRTFLGKAKLRKANLMGSYLSDADLSGADLAHADLSGAELSCTILIGADLSKANLSEADLTKAILTNTDLLYANNLKGTILIDAICDKEILLIAKERGAIIE